MKKLVLALALLLIPTLAQAAQVTLAWDASTQPEVTGYNIYYGTSSGNYTTKVDAKKVTQFTVTGLNPSTTYYFVATCYTATAQESGYSNQVFTTTPAPPDTTIPVISTFTIPATSLSLTITIVSFVATDNVAVTGYMVTETSTAPLATATGWSTTPPTSYTFTSFGSKTLYAWVKDAAGNVSVSKSATVVVTLSPPTIHVE